MIKDNLILTELINEYQADYNQIKSLSLEPNCLDVSNFISDYLNISNFSESDLFFSKYGIGNVITGENNPYERQNLYELLLKIMHLADSTHYFKIHKGTPYYFIGWTAFQFKNFAKAMFYMDAAVSEDLKFAEVKSKESTRPSLDFFLLKGDSGTSAMEIHSSLSKVIVETIQKFNAQSDRDLSIEEFQNFFISDLLYSDSSGRSLLCALYTFILEFSELEKILNTRSDTGGSIQPFLNHLFDGARILESLLEKYQISGRGLKKKISSCEKLNVNKEILLAEKSLLDAEKQIDLHLENNSSFQVVNFASAYIIRNATAHSLLWPDQFKSEKSYQKLYNSLINSIFWTIDKLSR